ncbi:MAG: carboxypeptidase-like regulatory domain-containing protein [Bacteroidota bacterium]
MKLFIIRQVCLSFLFVFLSFQSLFSQQKIAGKIKTVDGTSIENAKVELTSVIRDTKVQEITSDLNGKYVFKNVFPGKYFLKIKVPGYQESATEIFIIRAKMGVYLMPLTQIEKLKITQNRRPTSNR